MAASIFSALAELEETHGTAALCTVVRSEGSTPRHVGSKMLVYPDGRFLGTVGGGELEHRVQDEARRALEDGRARRLEYNMADPTRGDPGVCGGQVEVFVEPILPPPLLMVIGAGHVGKAVAHLAKWLGYRVAVSDDRPEFCSPDFIPDADLYLPLPMHQIPQHLQIDSRSVLILTTRGSNVDAEGLPALLDTPAAYIGIIGSKRRWATTVKALSERGVSREKIERVRSPIGLELHAETPEEIAVSILAEVLMVREQGTGRPMK